MAPTTTITDNTQGVLREGVAQPAKLGGSRSLRRLLLALDGFSVAAAWAIALCVPDGLDRAGWTRLPNTGLAVLLAVGATLALCASSRLYRARECAVRTVETVRIGRVAVAVAVVLQAGERRLGVDVTLGEALGGAVLAFVLQRLARSAYRSWLASHRRRGRHSRPLVLLGANDEALELYHLIDDNPELGYRIAAVMGDPGDVLARDYDVPFAGPVSGRPADEVAAAVAGIGANGVLVAASAVPSADLNRIVRSLLVARMHVHLSSGLRGIDHRRVRSHPLAHEPLLYLEPPSLARRQVVAKRCLDVALAGTGLVLAAPVFAACALAVKLTDRGPVFFRQERVGRDGHTFPILKFRSMVVDAEARLAELMAKNQREGALFKMADDPRITRIGKILRATSLDELPQLINVLRGEMSLVGPRPALPEEVAQFGEDLRARQQVLPGITGLWQVEARDSASFRSYQRLDLFYVENWSVGLDLAILVATVQSVLSRAVGALRGADAASLASG